jgi:hypothetical protein
MASTRPSNMDSASTSSSHHINLGAIPRTRTVSECGEHLYEFLKCAGDHPFSSQDECSQQSKTFVDCVYHPPLDQQIPTPITPSPSNPNEPLS